MESNNWAVKEKRTDLRREENMWHKGTRKHGIREAEEENGNLGRYSLCREKEGYGMKDSDSSRLE